MVIITQPDSFLQRAVLCVVLLGRRRTIWTHLGILEWCFISVKYITKDSEVGWVTAAVCAVKFSYCFVQCREVPIFAARAVMIILWTCPFTIVRADLSAISWLIYQVPSVLIVISPTGLSLKVNYWRSNLSDERPPFRIQCSPSHPEPTFRSPLFSSEGCSQTGVCDGNAPSYLNCPLENVFISSVAPFLNLQ